MQSSVWANFETIFALSIKILNGSKSYRDSFLKTFFFGKYARDKRNRARGRQWGLSELCNKSPAKKEQ